MNELQLSLSLSKDRILKKSIDEQVKGRIQILAGEKKDRKKREKINLVFLLDSSGSMRESFYNSGNSKSKTVIDAVSSLLSYIQPTDTISIISFNSQAIVRADHLPGNADSALRQALVEYGNDNGATNFEAAMQMAKSVCNSRANENHKLIFLTDGNAYGGNSANALSICSEMAKQGITTDSMGIGGDFNYNFMKQFTDYSGSLTENLTDPAQASTVFLNIYKSSSNVFLKKVFINLHFIKEIRDVHFFMHLPSQKNFDKFVQRNNNGTVVQVSAGDIEQQGFVEFLFDFTMDAPDSNSLQIGEAQIVYSCPSQNIDNESVTQAIFVNFSDSASDLIISSSIDIAYKDIEILIHETELNKLVNEKNFTQAAARLESMANLAEQIGDNEKANEFRKLKNKIVRDNALSMEDINNISYNSTKSSVRSAFKSTTSQNIKQVII
ncbi:MAG: VWA domain-containing protein [Candidatus Cloacimonetes bacterium]|nr:VWA domain-containing protein [Candidatus Cloacimonadota bacterium]